MVNSSELLNRVLAVRGVAMAYKTVLATRLRLKTATKVYAPRINLKWPYRVVLANALRHKAKI